MTPRIPHRCSKGHELSGKNIHREGSRVRCRQCRNDYFKRWRERNPAYDSLRYANDPTPKRASAANYRKKNPEKARTCVKKWRLANPERNAERNRDWQINNPDKRLAIDRRKRRNNPEKYRTHGRNKRARKQAASGSFTEAEWVELCVRFGDRCPSCGKPCTPTVDHIIPLSKGGTNDISNIQPLCGGCNSRKNNRLIVCYLPWPGAAQAKELHVLKQNKSDNCNRAHARLPARARHDH